MLADEILDALLPRYAERRAQHNAQEKPQSDQPTSFAPPPELLGEWIGSISTYSADVPFRMVFQPDGDIHARLGEGLVTLVNNATFVDKHLSGDLLGDMPTGDARRRPHELKLDLALRGDVLNGAVITISTQPDGEGGRPGRRFGNALAYWAELHRITP